MDKMSIFPAKILLATDGSKEATLAAQTAIDLANKTGSELHVVHVRIPLDYPLLSEGYYEGVDVGADLSEGSEELVRIGEARLDEAVRKIEAAGGSVARDHLRLGRPDVQITVLAEQIGAGLIVVGSRGLSGMRRARLGSVSSCVVEHAQWSVLVVR